MNLSNTALGKIVALTFFGTILTVLIAGGISVTVTNQNKIIMGVQAHGTTIAGMSKSEAHKYFASLAASKLQRKAAVLTYKERNFQIDPADINLHGNVDEAIAYLNSLPRPGRKDAILLPAHAPALLYLMRIRDEAHRFGITFHRNLRSKAAIQSALREIKGVGEKTEQRLLMHYGSVARIAAAPLEELSALVGADLAIKVHDYLNND